MSICLWQLVENGVTKFTFYWDIKNIINKIIINEMVIESGNILGSIYQ